MSNLSKYILLIISLAIIYFFFSSETVIIHENIKTNKSNEIEPIENSECYEVGMKWEGHLLYTSGPFYELNVLEQTIDLKVLLPKKESITKLKINSLNLKELPEELFLFTNLEALDISDNPFIDLEKLIEDINKFHKLELLAMNHCGIKKLPDNIHLLRDLKGLALNQNVSLFEARSIGQLKNLRYLDLSANKKLKDLPETIGNLKCLEQIVLGGSGFIRLREELAQCINLKEITANACKIKSLPSDIGNLKKLIKLNLGANRIEIIPESIGELKQLKNLSLGTNEIFDLPESISNLNKLYSISLELNRFKTFPLEVLELKYLRYLNLIPIEVADLPNLTRVYVDQELISDQNIESLRRRNPDLQVERRDALRLVPEKPKRKN